MSNASPYEMIWRPTYEQWAALAWFGGALGAAATAMIGNLPNGPFLYMAGVAGVMGVSRGLQAWRHRKQMNALMGPGITFITPEELLEKFDPDRLWLGYGFEWGQKHAQRVNDILKGNISNMFPKRMGTKNEQRGEPWIHGVEAKEETLYTPIKHLEGNTMVWGTTGSGKTRLLELIICQEIERGSKDGTPSVVIIIDPKGDRDLRQAAQRGCSMAGRPDAFMHFHPAFPSRSVRIDPLANWNRPTQIASRIAALLPSEGGGDVFTSFSWMAVNNIVQAVVYIDQRPTLYTLRRHLEGGPEGLLMRTLEVHFDRVCPSWQEDVQPYMGKKKGREAILQAYVRFYQEQIAEQHSEPAVDGLINMFEHDGQHFGKMIASLMPIMNMLTSGELRGLLSPNLDDRHDPRPWTDSHSMINLSQVVYVGLDSLSDTTIGSAIGSILLADLASVAGDIYNSGEEDPIRVTLIIDEAAEVVNQPVIQLANKARGAGFNLILASQTFPDLIDRMGSEPKARMLVGNTNNMIALRTKDRVTQDLIVETFPETSVFRVMHSQNTSAVSDKNDPTSFSSSYGERLDEVDAPLFPAPLLGKLPDLQYIAMVSGGRVLKGRVPILKSEDKPSLAEMEWPAEPPTA